MVTFDFGVHLDMNHNNLYTEQTKNKEMEKTNKQTKCTEGKLNNERNLLLKACLFDFGHNDTIILTYQNH